MRIARCVECGTEHPRDIKRVLGLIYWRYKGAEYCKVGCITKVMERERVAKRREQRGNKTQG